jgi:uncharacterized protein YcgI (DUF1989 family)
MEQTTTRDAIQDFVIPARQGRAFEVSAGSIIRLTDLEGQQCVDIIAFNRHNFEEKISPFSSISKAGKIYFTTGDQVVSDELEALLTITSDDVGSHDMICGSCSPGMNRNRNNGLGAGKRTCHVNFVEQLRDYAIAPEDIPYSLNVFMNYPVDTDGLVSSASCKSRAGSAIEFRAEKDLLVAMSNCPQELTLLNGFNPTSSRIQVFPSQL